jgi:hypothetical protein
MLLKWLSVIKTYWVVVLMGAIVMGMLVFIHNQAEAISDLEESIETTEGLIADAKVAQSGLKEAFDREEHQEEIEQRTVSAKNIGQEIIEVDDALTAFYKTIDPLPEDKNERDSLFAELETAQTKNTELTGAGEADHIKTWQLNPEWTLKLESVVTYQDTDRVPIVFSMETADGKLAGLVHTIYNVNDHTLSDISRHYTTDGLQDEADVGGI